MIYNILVFPIFALLYLNTLSSPTLNDALVTGLIWCGITIVFDTFAWVLIKHPWSLTFKEFYIDYQPLITLIYSHSRVSCSRFFYEALFSLDLNKSIALKNNWKTVLKDIQKFYEELHKGFIIMLAIQWGFLQKMG